MKILLFIAPCCVKNIHRYKDIWTIIENLKRDFWYDTYILTKKWEETYDYKSKIIEIESNIFWFIKYIKKVKPEVLIMFWAVWHTLIYVILARIMRYKWKIYIKADIFLPNLRWYKNWNIHIYYRLLLKIFEKFSTVSFENQSDIELLNKKYNFHFFHIPNWIDLKNNSYKIWKKEKIILTVWRLGSIEKNTQEFLEIVKPILKNNPDYKAILAWEIQDETNFEKYKENYLKENQDIKDRIVFKWYLNNKNLYELYKQSKFFLFTSKYEWFAIIFAESAYFWNIIVTKDVWWARDILNNWEFWCIYKDKKEAINFINNTILYDVKHIDKQQKYIIENYSWENILNNINKTIIS
jgi:hypothetical protein